MRDSGNYYPTNKQISIWGMLDARDRLAVLLRVRLAVIAPRAIRPCRSGKRHTAKGVRNWRRVCTL